MFAALSRLVPSLHLVVFSLIVAIGSFQGDLSARGQEATRTGAEISAAAQTSLVTDVVILPSAVAVLEHQKPRAVPPPAGALPAAAELAPPPPRYLLPAAPRAPPRAEGLPPGRPLARSPPKA